MAANHGEDFNFCCHKKYSEDTVVTIFHIRNRKVGTWPIDFGFFEMGTGLHLSLYTILSGNLYKNETLLQWTRPKSLEGLRVREIYLHIHTRIYIHMCMCVCVFIFLRYGTGIQRVYIYMRK